MIKVLKQSPEAVCKHIDPQTLQNLSFGRVLRYKSHIETVRYRRDLSQNELKQYEEFKEKLFQEIYAILEALDVSSFYIISYDGEWIDEYLNCEADRNNCVLFSESLDDIRMIFEKALRYEAFPIIIDEKQKISFVPTDHLDVFVSFSQEKMLKSINKISSEFELAEWN